MAKLKEALFYTLHKSWMRTGYVVMAVTTEKTYQYFGRIVEDDSATHVRRSECKGRFDTAEAARAVVFAVQKAEEKHRPGIRAAREAVSKAEAARDRDVELALRGLFKVDA